jgi:hypothetical protein
MLRQHSILVFAAGVASCELLDCLSQRRLVNHWCSGPTIAMRVCPDFTAFKL